MPWRIQPDDPVLQFQAGVEGDWRRGLCCLLSGPEGGSRDRYVIFSGKECVSCDFWPKSAFREVALVDNEMLLEMA